MEIGHAGIGHEADQFVFDDRNLMAPDDFKNLGLIFEKQETESQKHAEPAGPSESSGSKA